MYISNGENKLVNLTIKKFVSHTPDIINQFKIEGWKHEEGSLINVFDGKISDKQRFNIKPLFTVRGYSVSMTLCTNAVGVLLVTYLPTFLMNVINQATVYVQNGNCELVVTINVTCMMVLTSGFNF